MNAKHTPGPWVVNGNIGRNGEIGIVAHSAPCIIAIMGNQREWPVEARANARLISESPAMHAWIESVISACDNGWPSISDKNRAIEEGRAILKRVSGE